MAIAVPNGLDQIISTYGNPQKAYGSLDGDWYLGSAGHPAVLETLGRLVEREAARGGRAARRGPDLARDGRETVVCCRLLLNRGSCQGRDTNGDRHDF